MMVFQGLLKPSSQTTPRRGNPSPSQHTKTSQSSDHSSQESSPVHEHLEHPYLREASHLAPIESEPPDLRELNNSLAALVAIFPDVQVEVFREMLSSFAPESRLAVVTEGLLKNKMHWTKGRYRVAGKETELVGAKRSEQGTRGAVSAEERFRTPEYKKAVKAIAYREFKGLSRSTINGVLAEFNHSYTLARPTLVALSAKSWRFSFSSLFLRRKPTSSEAEHHALVIWQSSGHGSIVPTLKSTGSAELDKELFESLIIPIQHKIQTEREDKDHALALELNNAEAESNEALHECECCFTATAFEQLSACDDGGHFLCFQCVRHALKEAVFGQGWQRNINLNNGTLRCLAAMADDCQGCVSQDLVMRACSEEKSGKDIIRKFNERLAEDSLLKTNLPLIRCPFCSYAEVDELYLPSTQRSWRLKMSGASSIYTLIFLVLGVGMTPFWLPTFLLFSFLFLLLSSRQTFGDFARTHFHSSLARLRRKRLGLKFTCQNDLCARSSCIACSKAWNDVHICHESSLLALRTQVELAMSLAIKRTCPRCNTSFVKSSGCNKLTCVCGYQMCYVCRKDIGNGEGYRHFCEHFRPNGGRGCTECAKCDLYRCEDDEVVVKKAKEEAERLWVEKEGTSLGDEKVRKALEEKWIAGSGRGGAHYWWGKSPWWRWRRWPNWEQVVDGVVESVVD